MRKENKKHLLFNIIGWAMALLTLYPIYIMIVNSFKGRSEIFKDVTALPSTFSFEYYTKAINKMNFLKAFGNSLFVTAVCVIIIVILSAMSAWVLVRVKSKGTTAIFYLYVVTMLIPFQSVMIPLTQYMARWKIDAINFSMMNSFWGLIFMQIGFRLSFSIFLYHGFLKSVPVSLEEAAMIDGCNYWQIFYKIVFPIMKPITTTVAILNVIAIWNDYLLPSLVLVNPELRTIPLSTFYFFGEFTIQWNLAMAGLVVTIIPVIVFYIICQKNIIEGAISGAVK